ncbi:MAG: hypothetical protein SF029_07990 [bacterium]|nr:hypothetical protein [bacterium]
MHRNETHQPVRLLPRRLPNGLLAWQATLAYIAAQHSPDALLELSVQPVPQNEAADIRWSGKVSWGTKAEQIEGAPTLQAALTLLWQEVERNHMIFISEEDTVRRPAGYSADEWVDAHTHELLWRVLETTQAVFGQDWQLVIIYQPTDTPHLRVQLRLLANNNAVTVGGRGPALIDAARDLYRNAAPAYAAAAGSSSLFEPTNAADPLP